jgi:hypothetical protein
VVVHTGTFASDDLTELGVRVPKSVECHELVNLAKCALVDAGDIAEGEEQEHRLAGRSEGFEKLALLKDVNT